MIPGYSLRPCNRCSMYSIKEWKEAHCYCWETKNRRGGGHSGWRRVQPIRRGTMFHRSNQISTHRIRTHLYRVNAILALEWRRENRPRIVLRKLSEFCKLSATSSLYATVLSEFIYKREYFNVIYYLHASFLLLWRVILQVLIYLGHYLHAYFYLWRIILIWICMHLLLLYEGLYCKY